MNLFRVGDKGVTRGGQPYEVVKLHRDKSITAAVHGVKMGFFENGMYSDDNASWADLLLPDDAFLEVIPGVTHTMKRLRECGWNDQLLLSIYPKLKRVDSTLSDRVTQTEKLIPTTRHKGYYMKVAEGHIGRIEIGSMKIFFTGEINIEEKL